MENKWISFLIVIGIILVIIAGIAYAVKYIKRTIRRKINNVLGCSVSELTHSLQEAELIQPKSVSGATNIYLKQIERDFPYFHNSDAEVAIKNFLTEYIGIKYEGKENFKNSNVDSGILSTIEKETPSDIQNIVFNKISISGYHKSDEYATISYQVSTGFDLHSKRYETRYKVNYTLRLSDNNIATKAVICPNCGATIESTSETKCPYCDTKIIRDTILNWVISSIVEE